MAAAAETKAERKVRLAQASGCVSQSADLTRNLSTTMVEWLSKVADRWRKPLPQNGEMTMEEATRKGRGLQVVVHQRRKDPVSEHEFLCLKAEIEAFGSEQLSLMRVDKVSVDDARYSIRVRAAIMDSEFDLTPDKLEELIRVGFAGAGVLRRQLAKAS